MTGSLGSEAAGVTGMTGVWPLILAWFKNGDGHLAGTRFLGRSRGLARSQSPFLNHALILPLSSVWLSTAEPVRLGPPRDIPSIGLQVALPAHMTELPLDNLTDWVRVGVKGDTEAFNEILVLSALPEGTLRDARTTAEEWIREAERQRTGYTVIAQRALLWRPLMVPLAPTTRRDEREGSDRSPPGDPLPSGAPATSSSSHPNGWEVLGQYRVDEKVVSSLQWFGRRAGQPAVIYVLTYDAVNGQPDAMRRLVESVAQSCQTRPIQPASTQPVRLGNRQVLPAQGISFQVPDALRMMIPNRPNMLVRAGAVDYVRNRLLPVLTLTTNPVRQDQTPQTRLKQSVDALLPALRPVGGRVVSSQPAKLGPQPAYEVVFSTVQRRDKLVTAVRLGIWRGQAMVLSLTYPADNVRQLVEAMEQVAGSFRLQP